MAHIAEKQAVDLGDDHDFEVEFDRTQMARYTMCYCCCCLPLMTSGLACVILPCIPCWMQKEAKAQTCTVTDRHIQYRAGWLNKVSKNVPLDRVQDISIEEGCIQRCFGVKSLGIQTAGSAGPVPEVSMVAPKNAEIVRDMIMARRDKAVLGKGLSEGGASRAGGADTGTDADGSSSTTKTNVARLATTTVPLSGASSLANEEVLVELRALRGSVGRIEAHIEEGLKNKEGGVVELE